MSDGGAVSGQPGREDTTAHACFPAPGSAAPWEHHGRAARRPRHMSPSGGGDRRASVVQVVGAPDGAGSTRGRFSVGVSVAKDRPRDGRPAGDGPVACCPSAARTAMQNSHSVNGHTVSPVHWGQREAPVQMASQPRQNMPARAQSALALRGTWPPWGRRSWTHGAISRVRTSASALPPPPSPRRPVPRPPGTPWWRWWGGFHDGAASIVKFDRRLASAPSPRPSPHASAPVCC